MLKPDPSERLTLAEQLRLLVSQGVPEEDAKTRLGKVFRLKEIIYRPNYAMSEKKRLDKLGHWASKCAQTVPTAIHADPDSAGVVYPFPRGSAIPTLG